MHGWSTVNAYLPHVESHGWAKFLLWRQARERLPTWRPSKQSGPPSMTFCLSHYRANRITSGRCLRRPHRPVLELGFPKKTTASRIDHLWRSARGNDRRRLVMIITCIIVSAFCSVGQAVLYRNICTCHTQEMCNSCLCHRKEQKQSYFSTSTYANC